MAGGGTIRKFKNAEVVFSEGEPSGSAYVIVKGAVELTKNSRHGAVRLASLKAGELFGEMGIIDGSPRSATARTVGPTTLKEISPENLLNGIQNDPDLSSKVMAKLVERLRAADELLAKAGVSRATGQKAQTTSKTSTPKKKGFFSRLFGNSDERKAPFEIIIADLLDDPDKTLTTQLFNSLKQAAEQIGGTLINVRRSETPFAVNDFTDSPMVWGQVKANAQRWLTDLQGDLLIWGQLRNGGTSAHLRMTQIHPLRQERAGTIRPVDAIDLPLELDDVLIGYFYAQVICALTPINKEQLDVLEALLGPALDGARPAMAKRMRELDNDEQVRFETGFANLLACYAIVKKSPDSFKEAEETYHKALRSMRRTKSPLLEGIIKRHLGYTQSAWFDLGGEKNLLEAAIETFQEASSFFTKEAYPNEWADLQNTIGQLLFKQDALAENDDHALRESIAAFQRALQVYSATSTPYRWGEAKHHLARALQLLGSQTGDLDMIARSAEACREALAVRSKTQTPMLWAATQNNLGSALFMLCQKTRKPETAEAAVKAFEAALEIYQARKATKLAQVTQKNLTRAQEVSLELAPLPSVEGVQETSDDEFYFEENDFEKEETTQESEPPPSS